MAQESPSIRTWLAWLVIACVLPAVIASAVLVYRDYQREYARIERSSIDTARALTLAVDRDLARSEAALKTLATSPHLDSGDLAAFHRQATEVLQYQTGSVIVLTATDGQQLVNTLRPFGRPLPRHANPTQLQRVLSTGKTVVSDLYIGAVARQPLVGVEIPVRRGNKTIYSMAMGIFPEHLGRILIDQHIPPDVVVSIFDSNGTVVARTHDIDRYIGHKGGPALIEHMTKVGEGSIETNTLEGIPVLAAFSRSTISNWTVAIGIPRATLTGELRRSLWFVVAVAVTMLAVGLALAWLIGGIVARSIRVLAKRALRLGYGKTVLVPRFRLKEANEAAEALLRASHLIAIRTAERDRAALAERRMFREKEQAEYAARHDPLTELANRTLFMEIVEQHLIVCQHQDAGFAVLYIDLDGFKSINDQYGHNIGDGLLRMAAARLRTGIRHSDVVARLGGDEFVAMLTDSDFGHATQIASKLIDELSLPYSIGGYSLEISASIGVACYPESGLSGDELLRHSDQAMYKAKVTGKHRYAVAD